MIVTIDKKLQGVNCKKIDTELHLLVRTGSWLIRRAMVRTRHSLMMMMLENLMILESIHLFNSTALTESSLEIREGGLRRFPRICCRHGAMAMKRGVRGLHEYPIALFCGLK